MTPAAVASTDRRLTDVLRTSRCLPFFREGSS
jgi:hypothetical protein